jgi:hypothetical protein
MEASLLALSTRCQKRWWTRLLVPLSLCFPPSWKDQGGPVNGKMMGNSLTLKMSWVLQCCYQFIKNYNLVDFGPFGCLIFKIRIQFSFGARISKFDFVK